MFVILVIIFQLHYFSLPWLILQTTATKLNNKAKTKQTNEQTTSKPTKPSKQASKQASKQPTNQQKIKETNKYQRGHQSL